MYICMLRGEISISEKIQGIYCVQQFSAHPDRQNLHIFLHIFIYRRQGEPESRHVIDKTLYREMVNEKNVCG